MVHSPNQSASNRSAPCLYNIVFWIMLGIVVIGGLVIIIASTWALPGTRLYPIKRLVEAARLDLTRATSEHLLLEMKYDDARLDEVETLIEQSRSVLVDFSAGFSDVIGENEWLIGGNRVLIHDDTQLVGRVQMGSYLTVYGRLNPDGSISASRIQPREYELRDTLHSIAGNQWLVDGITLFIAHDTVFHGNPSLDSEVHVVVYRLVENHLIARIIEEVSP